MSFRPESSRSQPTRSGSRLAAQHAFPQAALDPAMRREVIPPHPHASVRVLTHDFPSEICGWGSHPE
jgi:hypothetical protein